MLELMRYLSLVSDQHDGARAMFVVLCDILQKADDGWILKVRMEVEQRVDSGERGRSDMLKDIGWLCQHALRRADLRVQAFQPVCHSPLKERQPRPCQYRPGFCGTRSGRLRREQPASGAECFEDLRFIARVNYDDWHT